jgi:serine/threonine protein kinase
VKILPVPKEYKERCVLHDIFNEILIMEQFKGAPYICRLYDFGVDDDYYYIVMKLYKCSLRLWREKQKLPLTVALPLYMNIFNKVITNNDLIIS